MGAGGHAKVVADALLSSGAKVLGMLSNDPLNASLNDGLELLGGDNCLSQYPSDKVMLANGIGALPNKKKRWEIAEKMRNLGYEFIDVIHPSAIVSKSVKLSHGVQIMAGSIIQADTKIGQDSIINSGSCIDHDCSINSNCHIAPGVVISGGVVIGDGCHLGTGTIVIQNITIGSGCVIAAGSVIYKDIPSNQTLIQTKNNILKQQ